jgi:DNA polymerase-3 subunit epsilon
VGNEPPESYNKRALQAIDSFSFSNESFYIVDQGRIKTEKTVVYIERGIYKGFGYIDLTYSQLTNDELNSCIKKYSHNRDIQTILCRYVKNGIRKIKAEKDNTLFGEL